MNEDLTYKGFICLDSDETYVLVLRYNGEFLRLPLVNPSEDFDNVTNRSLSIVSLKVFDGTEQMKLDSPLLNNFEDFIVTIKSHATIQLEIESTAIKIIESNEENMLRMWEFVEEYYNSDTGSELFENFVKKDIWNNK